VWAAERVAGRQGVFEFGDLLREVQQRQEKGVPAST
jgi:hypothetical protein